MKNFFNTFDHVFDVTADGTYGGQFLFRSKPFFYFQGAFVHHVHVQGQMFEAAF